MKFILPATIGIIHSVLVRGIAGQHVKETEKQSSQLRKLQDLRITFSSHKWSRYFNERNNNPNPVEVVRRPISSIKCHGRNCGTKQLLYYKKVRDSSGDTLYSEDVLKSGTSRWTEWFSEEGGKNRNRQFCPTDSLVTKIQCKNSFCDNMKLECTKVGNHFRRHHHWYSSQSSITRSQASCPNNDDVIVGVQCHGSYCSKIRVYCSKITMRHSLINALLCTVCQGLISTLLVIPLIGYEPTCIAACATTAEIGGGGPEDIIADEVAGACLDEICPELTDAISRGGKENVNPRAVCVESDLC